LDAQLGQLIEHGLINKVVFDQLPLKVEYELTGLGESLIPVIAVTAQWGEDHRNELEKIL
ncbi:winged helix-turn-helix transcriptional regulator, partial [Sphingobacterium multivorum]